MPGHTAIVDTRANVTQCMQNIYTVHILNKALDVGVFVLHNATQTP